MHYHSSVMELVKALFFVCCLCLSLFGVFYLQILTHFDTNHEKYVQKTGIGFNTSFNSKCNNLTRSTKDQKLKILIFTSRKSGSSYTGYLFASHPDAFYMFEPLSVFKPFPLPNNVNFSAYGYKCITKPVKCRMDYLYNCQIHQFFKEALFRDPLHSERTNMWYNRIFADVEARHKIEANKAGLDTLCSEKKIIVIKTIRIEKVQDIVPMMKEGLKVRVC